MRKLIYGLIAVSLLIAPALAQSPKALDRFQSGSRLIDGDQLNKMVDAVNVLRATTFQTITAGSSFYTYTMSNNVGEVIFVSTVTISDERVTAPPNPFDGQVVGVNATNTITAFQFIANTGHTLAVTTPTVLTASTTAPQGYKWVFRASDAKWYRLQ